MIAACLGLAVALYAAEGDLVGTWKTQGPRFEEIWTVNNANKTWTITGVYRKDGAEVGTCHGTKIEYAEGALTFQRVFDKKPAPDLVDNVPCTFRLKDGQVELLVGAGAKASRKAMSRVGKTDDTVGAKPAEPSLKIPAGRINQSVVQYLRQNLGQQVGNGECSSMAYAALKQAGAKAKNAFKDNPGKDDYVWGNLVYVLEMKDGKRLESATAGLRIEPGDVMQFRDAKFKGKRDGGGTYNWSTPHHTAVVVEVKSQTKQLVVLHQNIEGKRFVTEKTFNMNDLQAGWIRIYQPVPR